MKIENLSWWAGLLEPFVRVVLIPCGGFDSLDLFQLILNFVLIPKTKASEKAIMFWKLRLKYRRRCVSHNVGNDKQEVLGAVIFTVQLKIRSGIMAVFDWFHSRWYPPSTQNHPATYFWFAETVCFFFSFIFCCVLILFGYIFSFFFFPPKTSIPRVCHYLSFLLNVQKTETLTLCFLDFVRRRTFYDLCC